ncbi:hypothetical protein, partial [Achromobacter xylosoxidans]|uniref:hypothetical protein n=1 Tax=Alcaligenes xylosoxydans xylosoxydans TaxID=85698 RepID=UPI003D075496
VFGGDHVHQVARHQLEQEENAVERVVQRRAVISRVSFSCVRCTFSGFIALPSLMCRVVG